MSDKPAAILDIYLMENEELLRSMEASLLQLESNSGDKPALEELFRAVHTIKGTSGILSNVNVGAFTHVLENFLDKARGGSMILNSTLISVLLQCHDHIRELIRFDSSSADKILPATLKISGERLLDSLKQPSAAGTKSDSLTNSNWLIYFFCHPEFFENGFEPSSFISYLRKGGEIISVKVLDADLAVSGFNPEKCFLGFEIELKTGWDSAELREVFEFVLSLSDLYLISPRMKLKEARDLLHNSARKSLMTALLEKYAYQEEDPERQESPALEFAEAAASSRDGATRSGETSKRFIRVDSDKLENLINLVSELVILNSNIRQMADHRADSELLEAANSMTRLVEEIREGSMNIRMVEIGSTFRQYERLVRDLSASVGKNVRLELRGTDTELDKTIVEKINDPLIHLVRNAIDHGIDSPEERRKAGKPEMATITLDAYHDMGNIVIEVSDDGGGINREKVVARAVERGLADTQKTYSDQEVWNFIFQPGFSTADKVTDISGRGVGMDVVKSIVESIRGSVSVESRAGEGTRVKLSLPLTLAIIEGFLVRAGNQSYIIPLDMVQESIELPRDLSAENHFINLRGEVVPYLVLSDFFGQAADDRGRKSVIIVQASTGKSGLIVDAIIGEYQTVIKPLGPVFEQLSGISAATILGSGEVALILDVPRLVLRARDRDESRYRSGKRRI